MESRKKDIEVGTLVLLKEDNLPMLCWRRARVISCTKGDDDRVRVVELHLVTPFPPELQTGKEIEQNIKNTDIEKKKAVAVSKTKRIRNMQGLTSVECPRKE